MTIVERKKQLRHEMLIKRAKLDKQIKEKYDHWICQRVWEFIRERNCKKIHCYIPMGAEIDLTPLIEKMLSENLTVIAPKTLPKPKLQNLILSSLDQLENGVFGTRHPANAEEYEGPFDLIIVPGLAFNADHFRLGYGGGYYDNFLVHHSETYKLGIAYPNQKMEEVPLEPHDIQLDTVLFAQI